MHTELIGRLKRQLKRAEQQRDAAEVLQKGNEEKFTYYGGFSLGYLKGKIAVLEDIIDDLEELPNGQQ